MTSRRQKTAYWGGRAFKELFPNASVKAPKVEKPTFDYEWFQIAPIAIFIAVVIGITSFYLAVRRPETNCAFKLAKPTKGTIPGRLTECVELEVAETDSAVIRGLSGRQSMPRERGMVLVFPEPVVQCIWMKDMRFNIDAIWLDSDKRIVHIERDLRPDSFPHLFCSQTSAKYVVEVNAGVAAAGQLQLKQQLDL
jgi:uncharacterized membrane protein (UPF0127 family)